MVRELSLTNSIQGGHCYSTWAVVQYQIEFQLLKPQATFQVIFRLH